MTALLEVRRLRKHFAVRRGALQRVAARVQALDGVDLTIQGGECLALVGESGSGKTTLGRCVLRLVDVTDGEIRFDGNDLLALGRSALRHSRRHIQMVFQDPYGSLNPRMLVGQIVEEPLQVHDTVPRARRRRRVRELLELVGLPKGSENRYPHEFSGGQRQRIAIARALAPEPRFLVADEPVSALDVSARAQIINLLQDLRLRFGLAILFITHDLATVAQIADRVAVLYLGKVVELATTGDLFATPRHPYTVSLLSAAPVPDPSRSRARIVLPGDAPSSLEPPAGCRFHPRCPIAKDRCREEEPVLLAEAASHQVACHFPGELETAPSSTSAGGTF